MLYPHALRCRCLPRSSGLHDQIPIRCSIHRLTAAAEGAQRIEVEKRRLRLDGVAWACKAAVSAAEARLKARAWRTWLDLNVGDLIPSSDCLVSFLLVSFFPCEYQTRLCLSPARLSVGDMSLLSQK